MGVNDQPLAKGANMSLLRCSQLEDGRLHAVVRWSDPSGTADVDVSALLLGADGRVRSDGDFVFYNSPAGGEGALRLPGKRAEDDAGEDRVAIDLEALPPEIERVAIVASLDSGTGANLGDVVGLRLVLLDPGGRARASFEVADPGEETAMVLGELYVRQEEWKFRAVGQDWDSGLAGLATDYGITVEDPADAAADGAPVTAVPGADLAAAPTHGDVVAVPEIADGGPTEITPAGIVPAYAAEPGGCAPPREPRAPGRGVRTRKKRMTAANLAPLTLALDPSWQPARLFSVSCSSATPTSRRSGRRPPCCPR